jgi:hypothetical protein
MTREEAIEGFRHSISMSKLDLKVNKKNMSIEREIMVLNSIARNEMAIEALEQEPKWIPVSERLPQKSEYGDVLVTYIPSAGTLWTTVMIAQYSDLMGIAKPSFHIGEVGKKSFQNITAQVTAWMPLPKPYKPQESEDK